MKILTFKRLVVLSAIGGVAYVHNQRGGDWSLASITDTIRHLLASAASKLGPSQDDALDRAARVGESAAHGGLSNERTSRPFGDHKRNDDTGRH